MNPPRIPPTIPPIAPDEIPEVELVCATDCVEVEVDSVLIDEAVVVVEVGDKAVLAALVEGIKDELEDVLGGADVVGVCVAVAVTGGFV
jgi:hypothetical protein